VGSLFWLNLQFRPGDEMSIESSIVEMAQAARAASVKLASCPSSRKNDILLKLVDNIDKKSSYIRQENQKDLEHATNAGLSDAMIDRLTITKETIGSMIEGLNDVIRLDDPVGSIGKTRLRPNGLQVSRRRIPLGVIGIIYESRPNVTIDAAAL